VDCAGVWLRTIGALSATYSSQVYRLVCSGRMLVMTLVAGARRWLFCSWAALTSNTATSFGVATGRTAVKGRPMLPATCTMCPAARSRSPMRVVVVPFPLVPVTAMTGQGQRV
jgi:hypothetical protein